MARKKKILFVCVENSCRSQMAEGFARALGGDRIESHSAGSRPSGEVNPRASAIMKERGIDLAGHRSKGLEELPRITWDVLVTMGCGDSCPFVTADAVVDWGLPDPKEMDDAGFRKVRDEIERKVRELWEGLG